MKIIWEDTISEKNVKDMAHVFISPQVLETGKYRQYGLQDKLDNFVVRNKSCFFFKLEIA